MLKFILWVLLVQKFLDGFGDCTRLVESVPLVLACVWHCATRSGLNDSVRSSGTAHDSSRAQSARSRMLSSVLDA
eukprot:5348698-Amphidinium_carterae.1